MPKTFPMLRSMILLIAGIWIGILVFLGYGVAGTIFRLIESKTQAGLLNGAILMRMNHLEWFCVASLLITGGLGVWNNRSRRSWIQMTMISICAVNLYVYSVLLTGQINDVKSRVGNFDLPRESDTRPERAEFDRLHRAYSTLVLVNLLLIISIAIAAASGKDPKDV